MNDFESESRILKWVTGNYISDIWDSFIFWLPAINFIKYVLNSRYWIIFIIRDRPFNLQGELWFFVSLRKFFRTTRVRIFIFLSRKTRIFFPKFNIRLYDKNSESDYFFFPPPKSEVKVEYWNELLEIIYLIYGIGGHRKLLGFYQ
jgi:hypothetical protein